MIDVKNLTKSFGDLEVLKGVSQHISKGERVVLIGPSGSGKSTFLRCLNLLETPTGGQIIFDGQDITDEKCDINKIRQKMGMVFQHFNLFPNMTILKNITLAPIRTGLMNREEAEKKAGASEARRPGRQGGRLSRTAFRRAETADRHRAGAVHAAGGDAV